MFEEFEEFEGFNEAMKKIYKIMGMPTPKNTNPKEGLSLEDYAKKLGGEVIEYQKTITVKEIQIGGKTVATAYYTSEIDGKKDKEESLETKLEHLQGQLEKEVEAQNFEKCAELRDTIEKLKNEQKDDK